MTKTKNRQTNFPKLADRETVIDRIRLYMAKNKIYTVTELGKRIGLSQANASKKMLGKAPFSLEEAIDIAACLNVEFGSIFFEDAHDETLNTMLNAR